MIKLYISLLIGIIGILLLSYTFLYYYGGPPTEHPVSIYKTIVKFISEILIERTPILIGNFFYYMLGFGFLFVPPFSFLAIFLGSKSLSYKRKLAFLAVILNSFNLLLSLLIAWFLFGLARGM